MRSDLLLELQTAGVSCRELRCWVECADGFRDRCGECKLEGPESCDEDLIAILVRKLVKATKQTDDALAQRDYWRDYTDRLCNRLMGR